MSEKCPKCGHVRTENDPSQNECPRCGIIYAKYHLLANEQAKSRAQEKKDQPIIEDPEEHVQEKIRRRVLERDQEIKEQQERKLRTQATLEALEEITDVPSKEVRTIAQKVRFEHTLQQEHDSAKAYTKWTIIRFGLIIFGIILLIKGGFWYYDYRQYSKISYKVVFTSGMQGYEPIDNLSEVSINIQRVYLYISWNSLPKGKHKYHIRIFDGSEELIWQHTTSFPSHEGAFNVWFWYPPKEELDKPGKWRFEISIDKRKVFEEYLTVRAPSEIE